MGSAQSYQYSIWRSVVSRRGQTLVNSEEKITKLSGYRAVQPIVRAFFIQSSSIKLYF